MWEWLLPAIGLVLFLGSATVYLRGSKDKGTIETLQRSNAALTERVAILEPQVEALTRANEVLQRTVNSADLIVDLKTQVLQALADHHNAAMTEMEKVHGDLTGLPKALALVIGEAIKENP
jgi:hypothetical protein